eukprot:gnl/Hemi2/19150_TR6347_c1_g1_i1.p1 gnl/Hemi2/19150_TR6347_c1_g1~~gnl/Hemi2/19150_TR6347_c1_g1_i1.p1  ORF type:complete len:398 (+),score=45.87 gnl/Hemi2/19150_TR6347_c1_g1_i1:28-1194(+)
MSTISVFTTLGQQKARAQEHATSVLRAARAETTEREGLTRREAPPACVTRPKAAVDVISVSREESVFDGASTDEDLDTVSNFLFDEDFEDDNDLPEETLSSYRLVPLNPGQHGEELISLFDAVVDAHEQQTQYVRLQTTYREQLLRLQAELSALGARVLTGTKARRACVYSRESRSWLVLSSRRVHRSPVVTMPLLSQAVELSCSSGKSLVEALTSLVDEGSTSVVYQVQRRPRVTGTSTVYLPRLRELEGAYEKVVQVKGLFTQLEAARAQSRGAMSGACRAFMEAVKSRFRGTAEEGLRFVVAARKNSATVVLLPRFSGAQYRLTCSLSEAMGLLAHLQLPGKTPSQTWEVVQAEFAKLFNSAGAAEAKESDPGSCVRVLLTRVGR